MNMTDMIIKKRNGLELSEREIREVIAGYTSGIIKDYQMSALLMAIYFQDLTDDEVFILTDAMKKSGKVIDLGDISGIKVDKHSSGGVGDKISITAGPIAATAGVKIAKMSGRGLGFTGGTIDKLESIHGFRTDLSIDEFKDIVNTIGICIIGQTEDIAKADKLIYALRDVTGTVDVKGLIASSIMSKKLAMGSDAILLDVKFGQGALMKTKEDASKLAQLMIKIGENAGKKIEVMLSDMNEPLGQAIGNANEVIEAIETLKGKGPKDLTDLSIEIAGTMIYMAEIVSSKDEGMNVAKKMINSGKALDKMKEFIKAQGGNENIVDDYSLMPQPQHKIKLTGSDIGIKDTAKIQSIRADIVGMASLLCGAGRMTKESKIDLSAGITLVKKSGDVVNASSVVAEIYGQDVTKVESAALKLKEAYHLIENIN